METTLTLRHCATLLCLLAAAVTGTAKAAGEPRSAEAWQASATGGHSNQARLQITKHKNAAQAELKSPRKSPNGFWGSNSSYAGPVRACWYWLSDQGLKQDISLLERTPAGLGLYAYRYVWSDTVYVGVLAQEVAVAVPEAVTVAPDGHLAVDYQRLGLELVTLEQWVAAQRR
ncbi:hypothetical protein LNV08_10335 [Paucibacter sp. TC2R-5]|uniref:tail fiber domain-containing protein n=1 Tax=Paucibacter sp. TC2R-5 TaxID=2893555 RepID=UPI0021E37FAC|nr:hypothetical protein [Paucibacter sp. TC2R-5]MCV2359370.1 hypothetical protein [Paucibacter sp. TC2R-5]